jgi:hypothetical protein
LQKARSERSAIRACDRARNLAKIEPTSAPNTMIRIRGQGGFNRNPDGDSKNSPFRRRRVDEHSARSPASTSGAAFGLRPRRGPEEHQQQAGGPYVYMARLAADDLPLVPAIARCQTGPQAIPPHRSLLFARRL